MKKHKHKFENDVCRTCGMYSWWEMKDEKEEYRSCISRKSAYCVDKVKGTKSRRICTACNEHLIRGNWL